MTSRISSAAALALICATANGQARLNDTGVSQAYDSGGLWPCNATNTGDASAHPRQDCRFGRDAMADAGTLSKTGGGPAGFDWTPLDGNGQSIVIVSGVPATAPTCVRDNVTNLMWEVKSVSAGPRNFNHTYFWFDSNTSSNGGVSGEADGSTACGGIACDTEKFIAAVNASSLCGFSGWRLPTRRELLSIAQNGLASTAIYDSNFFPNSQQGVHWSADSLRVNPGYAWVVGDLTYPVQKLTYYAGGYQHVRAPTRAVRTLP